MAPPPPPTPLPFLPAAPPSTSEPSPPRTCTSASAAATATAGRTGATALPSPLGAPRRRAPPRRVSTATLPRSPRRPHPRPRPSPSSRSSAPSPHTAPTPRRRPRTGAARCVELLCTTSPSHRKRSLDAVLVVPPRACRPSATSSPWSAPSPAIPDAPVCLCVEPCHQANRGSELAAVTNPTLSATTTCPDDAHGPRCCARRRAEPAPRALPRAPSCSCARAARRAKLRPVLATVTRSPCRRATESQRRRRPHLDD